MLAILNVSAFRTQTPDQLRTSDSHLGDSVKVSARRKYWLPHSLYGGLVMAALVALCSLTVQGQQAPVVENLSAPPLPNAAHDYIRMLNETVDPMSGAVNLRINIPAPKGRGINLPFAVTYNSNQTLVIQPDPNTGVWWVPRTIESLAVGGWAMALPQLSDFASSYTLDANDAQYGDGSSVCHMVSNFVFTDENGVSQSFDWAYIFDNVSFNNTTSYNYDLDSACKAANFTIPVGDSSWGGNSTTYTMYAHGDQAFYQGAITQIPPDPNTLPYPPYPTTPPSPTPPQGVPVVAGPDGTVYTFPSIPFCDRPSCTTVTPSSIEDRNGNIVNLYNGVRDTAGRNAASVTGWTDVPTLTTVTGADGQQYKFTWQTVTYGPYNVPAINLGTQGGCPSGQNQTFSTSPPGGGADFNQMVTSISLPNGKSYRLTYDPLYGTLQQITYPDGAYTRYQYAPEPVYGQVVAPWGNGETCAFNVQRVMVTSRQVGFVDASGANHPTQTQTFAYVDTSNGAAPQTTVTTTDNLRNVSYDTVYADNTVTYKSGVGSSAPVLRSTVKGFYQPGDLPACEIETNAAGLSRGIIYEYAVVSAQYSGTVRVPTGSREYGYGQITPSACAAGGNGPSNPARETLVTNQSFGATNYPASSLLNLPCKMVVNDSNGNPASETDYYYDGGTALCGTPGAQVTAAVTGLPSGTHDDANLYGSSATISRGNITQIVKKCFGCTDVVTQYAYDETGQVTQVKDAKNNITHISHADNPPNSLGSGVNSNAYVTLIDPRDSNNAAVNGVSHATTFSYNYHTGNVASTTDPNSQTTSYTYSDPLNRLTQVSYPDGGQTGYCYTDVGGSYPGGSCSTSSTFQVYAGTKTASSSYLTSSTTYDGLGRATQTCTTSLSTPICTDTSYDGMDRVWTISNPYQDSSPTGYISYAYDPLGRKIQETEQDGNTLAWCYDGTANAVFSTCPNSSSVTNATWVTSLDEAGHLSQHVSDGLGRLVAVMEQQPSGTALALETDYIYNALDDLTYVNQKGTSGDTPRTRSFVYDSLSRLTSSTNPETGTIQYSYVTPGGGICAGDPSLPCLKTDARGITLTYTYDSLNRTTSGQGPGINYSYGYDSLSGAPSGSNNIGRLVSASNAINANEIFSYDPMGRLNWQSSWTPQSPNHTGIVMSANYDLAGNMTSFTYPDGRTVSQTFDGAAHLTNVNYASWNGTTINQPYFTATDSTDYDPMGHLVGGTIGTGLPYNAAYDNRGRIQSLGYGPITTPLWSKQYAWLPNSNLQTITDQVSGVQRQFSYDSLNRLTSAQDIFASWSSGGSSPGNCTTGSAAGTGSVSGASPQWTNPDDSNMLTNADTPGASSWYVNVGALTASSFAAPDGTMSATTLTANGGSSDTYVTDDVASPALYNSTTVSGSVWLRSTSGTQTVNVYIVENWIGGWAIAGWKQVQLTTTWQQVQVSGTVVNNLNWLALQIGGGGSVTSGQSVALWNPMLEDAGSADPSITNFLPYSQRTTASGWGVSQGSLADATAPAPDGTNTAATLTANSGSSDTFAWNSVNNPAPLSGLAVTASVWLRVTSGSHTLLLTMGETNASGWQTLGATDVTATTSWQRFQITGTTLSNLDEMSFQIGGAATLTGGSVEIWGAQIELASTAGPYVPTAAEPVTMGTGLTNILPFSQNLNGPGWGIANGSLTQSNVSAPDGTATAATVTATSSSPDTYAIDSALNPSLYDGATVTGSVYLRVASGTLNTNLYIVNTGNSGWGLVGQVAVTLTTQWQRFTVTGTNQTGLTQLSLQMGGGGSVTNGQAMQIWGAQMEIASTAGPYVATSALPVVTGKEFANILPNSQQLSGPSWGVANGSAALNSAAAPDGTVTAATVTANSASPDTYAIDNVSNPSLYDGQTMTGSVYLRVPNGTLNTNIYIVNVGDNGWSVPSYTPVTLTTTWQRFTVTGTNQNGLTQLSLQIGGGGSVTSGQSYQVWGVQMVPGSDPAPYTPTTCSTTNYVSNQVGTLVPNGLNEAYSYDSFGNILQNGGFNSGYAANNHMVGYAYDAAGNLASDGLFNVYTWDAEGQLTSNGSATYIYDAEGQRVEKQGVGVTDTVYFSGRPVARLSGGQWTDLIYGPTGMLAEVPGTQTGVPSFRMLDHLGNEVGTLGSNGQLTNPLDYRPFGGIFSGATTDPYLFTGKERDAESGNDYFGARYYASTMGRFMSPDWSAKIEPVPYSKLDYPQSLNLYSYVGNNPLSNADSDGHACFSLNASSGFCTRATEYGQIDSNSAIQSQTRFFAAANAVSQALADVAVPVLSRFEISSSTANFLEGVGENLQKLNESEASAIQNGTLSGPNLDQQLVHNEQSAVQGQLDNLQQSDAAAYKSTISEINSALNPGTVGQFASTRFATDKAYAGVLDGVRKDLGRNIDFSKQSDREAIGNALIKHIRQTGGCDVNGSKQGGCK